MNTKKLFTAFVAALVFAAQLTFAAGTPENVTGVEATAIDSKSIGLTWNSAKDGGGGLVDHYRVYYGATSVFEAGQGDYENEVDTPNNATSYVVANLSPNTTYYFSVTAISSDNLESEEYSIEASAKTLTDTTTTPSQTDTASPTVTSVSAPDKTHVKVVFNEAVNLPATPQTAFSIVEQINPAKTLNVTAAVMDTTDTTGKTVLLTTAEQTSNVNYIVTAGVLVKDLAGNPIVSGGTDSGLFLGSSVAAAAPTGTVTQPVITASTTDTQTTDTTQTAEVKDCKTDMACFLDQMKTGAPASVTESDATHEYKIEIGGTEGENVLIKYTAVKLPSASYAGADMTCKVPKGTYANVEAYRAAFDVKNCVGGLTVVYEATALKDTTPPENVTNLLLSFREQLEKFVVMLSWTPSLNSAKDLVDQVLYMSLDRGKTYDTGKSLGPIEAKTEVADLEGGKEYTFKVTTKDASGNESTGAVKSIRLPQTGMGVGLALMLSALGAKKILRRKQKNDLI